MTQSLNMIFSLIINKEEIQFFSYMRFSLIINKEEIQFFNYDLTMMFN